MKQTRILMIDELLVTQINHWSLFPVMAAITGLTMQFTGAQRPNLLLWALCGLLPFLLFLVREKSRRFLPFFALHLLLAGVTAFLPAGNIVDRIFAVFCGIFYLIYSLYLHFAPDSSGYDIKYASPIVVLLSAGSFLLQHYQGAEFAGAAAGSTGNAATQMYYIVPLIAVLAMYFISYYLESYLDFLRLNTETTGYLPEREMFRSGIRLVLLYTAGAGLLLFFTSNIGWLSAILRILQETAKTILRFLVSLFPESSSEEEILLEEQMQGQGEMPLPQEGESFWLWDVLAAVVCAGMLVFAAFLLCKALRRLFFYLREHFGRARVEAAKEDAAVFDIRERCEVATGGTRRAFSSLFKRLSPSERIRRYYKQRVLADRKLLTKSGSTSELSLYTAREYADKAGIPVMAAIYEKARYSSTGADLDDAKKLRQALRKELGKDR